MAKGYWLVAVDIVDPSAVERFFAASDRAFRKFRGQLLLRGGCPETVEGAGRSQFLVVEFKDYEQAPVGWSG
jgi:uncharacterized protein (DUF1330 family)